MNLPRLAHRDTDRSDTIYQDRLNSPASGAHDGIRSTDTTVTIVFHGVHETLSLDVIALLAQRDSTDTELNAGSPSELHPDGQSSDAAINELPNVSVEQ